MGSHTKEFSYTFGASLITAIRVEVSEAFVSVETQGGEIVETRWPLDMYFDKKPVIGKWLVDGFAGERFILASDELGHLGVETTDASPED